MTEDFEGPPAPVCPNCGASQNSPGDYCANCGARLMPETFDRQFESSCFALLLTLPAISVLALGSCLATLGVVGGALFLDWKTVAIGVAALLVIIVLARILRFFNLKP